MSIKDEKADNESYSKNFTRTPNVLFVAYPDLSREEKYLYINLRRIYWDMKPRFVSLRELSISTHYASSALSKMLPHLNDAGLIHAEIRREKARNGRERGNPKYYITIVDIWEVNRVFYSCSQKEQDELAGLPSAQLVHKMNDLVHEKNKPVHEKNDLVSFGEQDQAQVERAKDINKDTLKDPSKESNMSSSDDAPSHQSEKEKNLEREVADLRAQIAHILQATDTPPFDARPTPAGGNTTTAGENHLDATDTMAPNHNATQSVQHDENQGGTECTALVTHPENIPSESPLQAQEMPLSTQAVGKSNRQATEQPQQQSSSDSPIAGVTTKNPPATNNAIPQKPRGGRGKGVTGKEEKPKKAKPAVSEEEMALRKELHIWVNQRRGYSLQNRATTRQIIDENTACITLGHMLYVAQYEQNTEEGCIWDDLSFVWDHSVKNDKYWSQPNNKSRFGAHALLQMFAQTIVKRKPNNVTPMRSANNPPVQQEPTPEKAASIAAAEAAMARFKQKQAI